MTKRLTLEEMALAAAETGNSKMKTEAHRFLSMIETLGSAFALKLAVHLGIERGECTLDPDRNVTLTSFFALTSEQPCPEVLQLHGIGEWRTKAGPPAGPASGATKTARHRLN